ncbi:MAG: hypothetical protein U1E62_12005 [Alsobacter sp.]
MAFCKFTRPDGSPVLVNPDEVVTCVDVPKDSVLKVGTRINFRNLQHQDVKELLDDVLAELNAARGTTQNLTSKRTSRAQVSKQKSARV